MRTLHTVNVVFTLYNAVYIFPDQMNAVFDFFKFGQRNFLLMRLTLNFDVIYMNVFLEFRPMTLLCFAVILQ